MRFPTAKELIAMHHRIVERTGGHQGVLDSGAVDSALERAKWGPFYAEDDLAHRAALLLRGICQDHPFVDGNKRTAFEAADELLAGNGLRMEAAAGEIVDLMLDVAQGRLRVDEIAGWLRAHLRNPDEREETE